MFCSRFLYDTRKIFDFSTNGTLIREESFLVRLLIKYLISVDFFLIKIKLEAYGIRNGLYCCTF